MKVSYINLKIQGILLRNLRYWMKYSFSRHSISSLKQDEIFIFLTSDPSNFNIIGVLFKFEDRSKN